MARVPAADAPPVAGPTIGDDPASGQVGLGRSRAAARSALIGA
jgi:hypothetical protein